MKIKNIMFSLVMVMVICCSSFVMAEALLTEGKATAIGVGGSMGFGAGVVGTILVDGLGVTLLGGAPAGAASVFLGGTIGAVGGASSGVLLYVTTKAIYNKMKTTKLPDRKDFAKVLEKQERLYYENCSEYN